MRPEAAIIEVAPVRHEKLWRAVKDNLAKSDEHLKVAGEALLQLKADHDAQGGTWAEWEALVKERAGIGKSRASELMQIASGKKTAEEVKADSAERKKDQRLRDFTEKPDAPVIDGDYTVLDESEPQGNGADPEASAEDMKAKFAELDEGDEEQEPEALVQARKDYYASLEPPPSIAPNDDMQPALFSMAGTMANEAKRFKEFLARSTVSRELIDEVDKALDAWRDISIELEDRLERQQADEDGWIEGDPK